MSSLSRLDCELGLRMSQTGQRAPLGGQKEGPLGALLQKFGVLRERASFGPSVFRVVYARGFLSNDLLARLLDRESTKPLYPVSSPDGNLLLIVPSNQRIEPSRTTIR